MRTAPIVLLALAWSSGLAAQAPVPEVYTVDESHSLLDFTTRLVGFNRIRGTFAEWQADLVYDPATPTNGFVAFVARVASIATQVDERDQHLRSRDFFDADRFPRIEFQGRVVAAVGNRLDIEGNLTIRDSTRRVTLHVEQAGPEHIDQFSNRRVVFATSVTLSRRDYGVIGPRFWSQAISDSVVLEVELAGRIWNYRSVEFGRQNAVYGPRIVAAAGSGRFDALLPALRRDLAAETDSSRFPSSFETEVTVGRLVQQTKLREALATVEMLEAVGLRGWTAAARARLQTRKGEVLLRLGRVPDARRALEAAVGFDPTSTNARAWRWVADSLTRSNSP